MIRVYTLTSERKLAALESEWDRLHAAAADASVFNSWAWQFRWWQAYGNDQPLRVLLASEGGRTLGIVALYLHSGSEMGVPVSTLRFVGTGGDTGPDDLGAVLAPGEEAEVAAALAEAVMRLGGWDVLHLTDMRPQSAFGRALRAAAASAGFAHARGVSEEIVYINLPPTWDAFLAAQSAERRRRIRSARRKLEATCPTRFYVWSDPAGLDTAIERLAHLHRKRWRMTGETGSFASDEYMELHRAVVKDCMARGWLRLYCLEVAGELAAMTYCYRFRDTLYVMQAGFDPDLARFRPGHVLLMQAIEHSIGEGTARFDFLRGRHRYKDEVANAARQTTYLSVYRPRLAAWAYRTRRVYLPAWKAQVRAAAAALPRLGSERPQA